MYSGMRHVNRSRPPAAFRPRGNSPSARHWWKLHTLTCLLCTEQYTSNEKNLQEGIVLPAKVWYNERQEREGVR